MKKRKNLAWCLMLGGLALLIVPALLVGQEGKEKENTTLKLGGSDRFITHVSTDKPIYRPGETVYVRSVITHAITNLPNLKGGSGVVEIVSPRGDVVARGNSNFKDAALGWQWKIDPATPGGDYKVKVTPMRGDPPGEREFNIRAFRQKRLRTQIEFARKGYGPGDNVAATLEVSRSEGGIPVGAKADVTARVDRGVAWKGTAIVGNDGFATVRFKLPETIVQGEGTLSFAIEDGGVVETASKTIPILVSRVDLAAYPEGGDLAAGVENRVYFEAIAPNGRPADVRVELVDSKGNSICDADTQHEGRGSFSFIPGAAETYTLRVIEPWNVETEIPLPKAKPGWVALHAIRDIYGPGEPVEVELAPAGNYVVQISRRERVIGEKILQQKNRILTGTARVAFELPPDVSGVLLVTVFKDDLPIAERLVYREPDKKLHIEVEPDRDAYVPGEKVTLKIRTMDDSGSPVPGVIGLTVTDDATLEMVETREKAPRLPVQVYLEPEVKELADAHVYLSDDPEAPRALDLLLGTQGWRRFAFITVDEFLKRHGDAARRVLAEKQPIRRGNRFFFGGRGRAGIREIKENGKAVPMPAAIPLFMAPQEKVRQIDDVDFAQNIVLADFAEPVEIKLAGEKKPEALAEVPARDRVPADLKKQLMDVEVMAGEIRPVASVASSPVMGVRVYSHIVRANRLPNDRVDFAETLYWNAGIKTDEKGEAELSFDLSDSVTSFRALADGFTEAGAFGSSDSVIESRRPFYVETKAPLEITAGDRVNLPVVLVNETDEEREAALAVSAGEGITLLKYPETVTIPARSRIRVIVPAEVEVAESKAAPELMVTATCGSFTDSLTRRIPVDPPGFPVEVNFGGLLEDQAIHTITIPPSLTGGGVEASSSVYPTPLGNLTGALEALIRDPHGCFEQTSSTNYPLVMAMSYFETHSGVNPELVKRSREKLDKGYKRLVGFECKEKGYEWFGGDPGHEALTAYGLLEFTDMNHIYPVDRDMMERTRNWLLSRRDGEGGFKRNSRALDSFGRAPDRVTNAYITWSLVSAGEKTLDKELDSSLEEAKKSGDPYVAALAAGALIQAGRDADAAPLLKLLAGKQDRDGSVKGAETSITRSGGQSLVVETTSLSILAWLSDRAWSANVEKAMKWLCSACEGGRFGSTQSTVLALKAIIAYDQSRSELKAGGAVVLFVDGTEKERIPFTKEVEGALDFEDFSSTLSPGTHEIMLKMEGGSPMPYSITVGYNAEKPADSGDCPITLETEITEEQVKEGEPVELVARLKNTKDEGQPMTLVVIGLPGGLEPRHEQLKESVKAGKFSFYEVLGRDVAIYFRDLPPNAEKEIVISAIAAVPGEYTGPAGRAGLYYTPEEKKWTDGLKIRILEK